MRLKATDPKPPAYFVRSGLDKPERGPLNLENLKDLAEFGNITPDWLVRNSAEEGFRSFRDLPELMLTVFPKKKSFHFKRYQQAADADAGRAAADVKDLYRCTADPSAKNEAMDQGGEASDKALEPAIPEDPKPSPADAAPAPDGVDVKAILQASEAMTKKRSGKNMRPERTPLSLNRALFVVRWILAIFFVLVGLIMLGATGNWMMALPALALAVLLVTLDFVGWMCDGLVQWIANAAGEPPDFSHAENRLRIGDWPAAASAFLEETKRHPKEIRGYFGGITAAFAAGDKKATAAFHSLARKHLSTQDLNLINGALRRRNIPPVPPSA